MCKTKDDYNRYRGAVEHFFRQEGLDNLSTVSDEEGNTEPYFSWRPCSCCRRTLGGDRYDCNGYNPTAKEVQDGYSVCVDCVYYAEYGQLDDQTMLEINRS